MKKLFALILAMLMLCGFCLAESADYSSMTDEQLHAVVDAARNELAKRELVAAENLVLIDQDGVQMYMTGKYKVWGNDNVYLTLEVVVVNDSARIVSVSFDNASVNGWETFSTGVGETSPGKKQKGTLEFRISDADIKTYEEVQDIELNMYLYDMAEWETISKVDTYTLHLNAAE